MSQRFRHDDMEGQVNDYLDRLMHGVVLFRSGLQLSLQDRPDEFRGRLAELRAMAQQAAGLRRAMTAQLYRSLRWDARGRALTDCLESTEAIISRMTATLVRYAVERPEPVVDGNALLLELAESAKHAVDCMSVTLRAHFRNAAEVAADAERVRSAREDTSGLSERYRGLICRMDLRLSHKSQLCSFADAIEDIAAVAAHAVDRLAAIDRGRDTIFNPWALGKVATGWLVLSIVALAVIFALTVFAP